MSKLTILPRSAWHPEPRGGTVTPRSLDSIREIFLHWPGESPSSWDKVNTQTEECQSIKGFQRYHIHNNGWSDIGYSHVMGNSGSVPRIYVARGAEFIPAAQLGHNAGTLALLLLIGPGDSVSKAMVRRIRSYVRYVEHVTGHSQTVRGHGEVFSTDCPGPAVRKLIRERAFSLPGR